ncbi:MAG: glycoside hydrolase family 32 protein [Chitinophagaceae bacterium]|nr:glycoside hydrolase family 32 protein [Chitinophagaceae bacterium]MCW5927080.1 glycoside hydrolase family 32 protein [Chitinophagaceae bacterium]
MIAKAKWLLLASFVISFQTLWSQSDAYTDKHRPQLHFSPKKGWMNDPNGMVYHNGKYHLFFQHYPDSTVWGPMHWGHAVSADLVHWEELPIALYPDAIGTIFSGSAVIDKNNTAGFGANAIVAVYTSHNHTMEKDGFDKIETQSIAYSLDEGKTWTKYKGNPVLPNPGIRDFRDPKVSWYEPAQKWIMTLATKDHITFYSSSDLKNWKEESKFGKDLGAHGGVWECPDLIPFEVDGKQVWVLIVNLNPGAPNGGSGTQYFTGSFDGSVFTPDDTDTKWLDYGPDNYAGITWSNTGDEKLFIGWMSNWVYANIVPTKNWRSATTVARKLGLTKEVGRYRVVSTPVSALEELKTKEFTTKSKSIKKLDVTAGAGALTGPALLQFNTDELKSFSIELSNTTGEKTVIGYDRTANNYFIDRSQSGKTGFHKDFANIATAPRLSSAKNADITLVIDNASVELFADNGLSVMTAIFFPESDYTNVSIHSADKLKIKELSFKHLKRIWK